MSELAWYLACGRAERNLVPIEVYGPADSGQPYGPGFGEGAILQSVSSCFGLPTLPLSDDLSAFGSSTPGL